MSSPLMPWVVSARKHGTARPRFTIGQSILEASYRRLEPEYAALLAGMTAAVTPG